MLLNTDQYNWDHTRAQVVLNWCLSQSNVIVIPKSNSVDRTIENCEASGWSLSPRQVTALNAVYPNGLYSYQELHLLI
ncbi:MAG TPA: hypothetical protein DD460_02100 [Acidobacteria bacterium]|nr:hypothetical protein [Acidobacteriota bacterium]